MNGYPRFGWVDILRFQQHAKDTAIPIEIEGTPTEDETDGVECASQPVSNPKTKKSKGGILITVQTMGGLFIKKVGLIMTV